MEMVFSIFLVMGAFLFLLLGLIGAVVPVLPGPPLGFIGLLLLQWSGYGGFSSNFLWGWGIAAVVITVMDYILPAVLTKKSGGSRLAVIGSIVGFIIGIFIVPPFGILLGTFFGALGGEFLNYHIQSKKNNANIVNNGENATAVIDSAEIQKIKRQENIRILKIALSVFLAFILGTGAKLVAGFMMIFYAIKAFFT